MSELQGQSNIAQCLGTEPETKRAMRHALNKRYEARISMLKKETAAAKLEVEDRYKELARLTQLMEARACGGENLQDHVDRLEAEVNALRLSTSWRLTTPLRKLAQMVRPKRY